jgi:hypothetical protein
MLASFLGVLPSALLRIPSICAMILLFWPFPALTPLKFVLFPYFKSFKGKRAIFSKYINSLKNYLLNQFSFSLLRALWSLFLPVLLDSDWVSLETYNGSEPWGKRTSVRTPWFSKR